MRAAVRAAVRTAVLVAAGAAMAATGCTGDGGDGGDAPVELAVSPDQPEDLAITAGAIYWTGDGGGLFRVPRGGGGVDVLVATGTPGWVTALAADDTWLYFAFRAIDGTGTSIQRMPAGGGAAEVLVTGIGIGELGGMILVDGVLVYSTSRELWKLTATGPEQFATLSGRPEELAAAGGHVYAGTGPSERISTVVRVPLAGGEVETLATGLSYPFGLTVIGDQLAFTDYYRGRVHQVPLAGGELTTLVDDDNTCRLIATRGDRLYYASEFGGQATLREIAPGTGAVTLQRSERIAGPRADADGVVWFDGDVLLTASP